MLRVELQLVVLQCGKRVDELLEPVHRRHTITADVGHQGTTLKEWVIFKIDRHVVVKYKKSSVGKTKPNKFFMVGPTGFEPDFSFPNSALDCI